jgi:magnesium chelatase family protein
MITRLFLAALRGVDAQEVEVEVNARGADKPVVIIVEEAFPTLKYILNQ